jgi:hypothetical protein
MENLLEIAQKKFKKTKEGVNNFSKDFKIFLLECYIHLTPASYGNQIQKRILKHLNKVEPLSSKRNCADFSIGNWELLLCNEYIKKVMDYYEANKYFISDNMIAPYRNVLLTLLNYFREKYNYSGEIKVSYLNKSGSYTIRNLRPYQKYTHYLIFIVDCEDSFKYKISLIERNVLSKTLHLSDMHGIKDVNVDVTNKHLGGTIKKNSYEEEIIFNEYNLLESNSFESINNEITKILRPAEEEISKLTFEEIIEICPNFQDVYNKITTR